MIKVIVKYLFVLILFAVYLLFDTSLGFSASSPWWTHLTFAFQHAGWVHLIINSIVFINSFGVIEKRIRWYILLPVIYGASLISSLFYASDLPTVGCSGMIYAMFGMMLGIVIKNNARKQQKIMFCASLAFMMILSFFSKGSNFYVHFISFVIGFLFWIFRTYYHRSYAS